MSAMYGMCEDRDIGHMAHLLRCASKGRDYTSRLRRGARPAADASRKRPRCGEDGSAARPERRPESGPRGRRNPLPSSSTAYGMHQYRSMCRTAHLLQRVRKGRDPVEPRPDKRRAMGRKEHTLLDEGRASSPTDLRPSRESRNTQPPGLWLRALLTEDGDRRLRLHGFWS